MKHSFCATRFYPIYFVSSLYPARLLRLALSLMLLTTGAARLYAQTANAGVIDPQTGVIHSLKLLSGVPLGGIGAGKVEILTDGSFAHSTVMNNWDCPTGSLPGCFAAIWTRTGTQVMARVLALDSAYGLPAITHLDFDGLAPQTQLTYPDPALPLSVNLLAFSPLVPFVIKDSCFPAAAFVFRIKNTLPVPAELSVAFSWEGLLGLGSDGHGRPFRNRDGVRVATIPSAESYFGLRFASPIATDGANAPVRLRANASGEMVLMAYPPRPQTVVTTAGWNALNARPDWWDGFSKSGDVSGMVGTGQENRVHPAGVVAVRLTLKPNDYVELPFAVTWYTPHHWLPDGQDVGHFYQNLFDDAEQAARRLLDQWPSLFGLTEEWQKRLTYSNLPRWLARRLINATAPLTADSVYTRDGRFALTPGATALPNQDHNDVPRPIADAQSNTRQHLAANALLLTLFPELDAQMLTQFAASMAAYGAVPPLAGNDLRTLLGPPQPDATVPSINAVVAPSLGRPAIPEDLMAAPIDSNSAYVLEAAQYAFWTGDLKLLKSIFPAVRAALTALLQSRNGTAFPSFAASASPHVGSLTLYLAALHAGLRLANTMRDMELAAACRDASARGAASLDTDYWNGECYGASKREPEAPSNCDMNELLGQWAADQLDLGALLPAEHLNKALKTLRTRAEIDLRNNEETSPPTTYYLPLTTYDSLATTLGVVALAIRQPDQAEAGVNLLRRLDDWRSNVLQAPWLSPQHLPDSAAPLTTPEADLGSAADWNLLYSIEGFTYEAVTGQMTLCPNLPGIWRVYNGPIFAPTFWGNLEYKPTAHGGLLNLRIDRLLSLSNKETLSSRKSVRAELTLRSLKVPGPLLTPGDSPAPPRSAYVSVGQRPIGCKTESDAAGNITLTFETPLSLTAGDRLQVDVH